MGGGDEGLIGGAGDAYADVASGSGDALRRIQFLDHFHQVIAGIIGVHSGHGGHIGRCGLHHGRNGCRDWSGDGVEIDTAGFLASLSVKPGHVILDLHEAHRQLDFAAEIELAAHSRFVAVDGACEDAIQHVSFGLQAHRGFLGRGAHRAGDFPIAKGQVELGAQVGHGEMHGNFVLFGEFDESSIFDRFIDEDGQDLFHLSFRRGIAGSRRLGDGRCCDRNGLRGGRCGGSHSTGQVDAAGFLACLGIKAGHVILDLHKAHRQADLAAEVEFAAHGSLVAVDDAGEDAIQHVGLGLQAHRSFLGRSTHGTGNFPIGECQVELSAKVGHGEVHGDLVLGSELLER